MELAEQQWADKPFIAEALKQCKEGWWDDPCFIYFTEFFYPRNASVTWFMNRGYFLKHQTKGIVQIDILRNGRIAGIQFLAKKKCIEI